MSRPLRHRIERARKAFTAALDALVGNDEPVAKPPVAPPRVAPPAPQAPIVQFTSHSKEIPMEQFLALIVPLGSGTTPPQPPLGIWGGGNVPMPSPPIYWPGFPNLPGGQPPGIWGGGNVPMPNPPIYWPGFPNLPGGQPPQIWGGPGSLPPFPMPPIFYPPHIWGPPDMPPGFWGGGMGPGVRPQPRPEHPIVLPPDYVPPTGPGVKPPVTPIPPGEVPPHPSTGVTSLYIWVPYVGVVGPIYVPPGVDAPPAKA